MKQPVCPYCKKEFLRSRFHPEQVVCSSPECQRHRRADYHRKKLAEGAMYKMACEDCKKEWKRNNPGYQQRYRTVARRRNDRTSLTRLIDDNLRCLRRAKNTLEKNSAALCANGGVVEVVWLSSPGARPAKNILARLKVIVIEQDPGFEG
jgi:hypothetical protein